MKTRIKKKSKGKLETYNISLQVKPQVARFMRDVENTVPQAWERWAFANVSQCLEDKTEIDSLILGTSEFTGAIEEAKRKTLHHAYDRARAPKTERSALVVEILNPDGSHLLWLDLDRRLASATKRFANDHSISVEKLLIRAMRHAMKKDK